MWYKNHIKTILCDRADHKISAMIALILAVTDPWEETTSGERYQT
jgi:hypothetical protein